MSNLTGWMTGWPHWKPDNALMAHHECCHAHPRAPNSGCLLIVVVWSMEVVWLPHRGATPSPSNEHHIVNKEMIIVHLSVCLLVCTLPRYLKWDRHTVTKFMRTSSSKYLKMVNFEEKLIKIKTDWMMASILQVTFCPQWQVTHYPWEISGSNPQANTTNCCMCSSNSLPRLQRVQLSSKFSPVM